MVSFKKHIKYSRYIFWALVILSIVLICCLYKFHSLNAIKIIGYSLQIIGTTFTVFHILKSYSNKTIMTFLKDYKFYRSHQLLTVHAQGCAELPKMKGDGTSVQTTKGLAANTRIDCIEDAVNNIFLLLNNSLRDNKLDHDEIQRILEEDKKYFKEKYNQLESESNSKDVKLFWPTVVGLIILFAGSFLTTFPEKIFNFWPPVGIDNFQYGTINMFV